MAICTSIMNIVSISSVPSATGSWRTEAQSKWITAAKPPGTIEIMKAQKKPLTSHARAWRFTSVGSHGSRPMSMAPKCHEASRGLTRTRSSQRT